jgi:quinol monooxygenase YgiN
MIARMRVRPENAAAYEALITEVAAQTLANEPGVPWYAWSKSADEADVYLVVEVYRDADAHAAHMASPWVRESLPRAQALIESIEIGQYVSDGSAPVRLTMGKG